MPCFSITNRKQRNNGCTAPNSWDCYFKSGCISRVRSRRVFINFVGAPGSEKFRDAAIQEICRVLALNFDEMDRLLVEDKLRYKYGPRYAEVLGEDPRYEEVKHDIAVLSPENWNLIKNMIKMTRRNQAIHAIHH